MALTHITLRDFVIVHELALDLSRLQRVDRRDRCGQIHFDRRFATGLGCPRRSQRGA
jgi:hypothetical protein